MNRTLVIGATGNIGRHVVSQLAAGGHHVRALTRGPDAPGPSPLVHDGIRASVPQ